MIPTKKEIAFVEYADETSAGAAKDALHNFKLDGEAKIKVDNRTRDSHFSCALGWALSRLCTHSPLFPSADHIR